MATPFRDAFFLKMQAFLRVLRGTVLYDYKVVFRDVEGAVPYNYIVVFLDVSFLKMQAFLRVL